MEDRFAGFLHGMQEAQQAFWQGAIRAPVCPDASAFGGTCSQAFDGLSGALVAHLPRGDGPDWRRLLAAQAAYRAVIAATWADIGAAFEVHRRALQGTPDADWRILRNRWLQVAEAAFIRTLRSDAFMAAQRDLLRAALAVWADLSPAIREAALATWQAADVTGNMVGSSMLAGVTIADTPKDRVWAEGRTTLFRYRPLGVASRLGPVLIAHGLIGRQTMTDLQPDRSLVRMLLAAGVDVFTIDWGDAGPEDATLGLDHFAGERMGQAIAAARAAAGQDVVLMGICMGGTLAACHAARFGAGLKGLITAVAPFDFHADREDPDPAHGILNLWLRSLEPADIDALLAIGPTVSGAVTSALFNALNPVRTLAKYTIDLPERSLEPGHLRLFLAMEKWLADRPGLPGALARTWLADFYIRNGLVGGRIHLAEKPVRLADIAVPVLNIHAVGDHICPPPCSRALGDHIATPYREVAIPAGHIGAFVGARAQTLLSPSIMAWLAELS